jgi:hypothetical protein
MCCLSKNAIYDPLPLLRRLDTIPSFDCHAYWDYIGKRVTGMDISRRLVIYGPGPNEKRL